MSSKAAFSNLIRTLGQPVVRRPAITTTRLAFIRGARPYSSTDIPPPPLLSKIKDDLKTAMRAKDQNRLSVLRAVLAAVVNASKTDAPIKTDVQLVVLLRKSAAKSREAAAEARMAGREDLAEKEEAQAKILEEYAESSSVRELTVDDLRKQVEATKAQLIGEGVKANQLFGQMMGKLMGDKVSPIANCVYDKAALVKLIREACQNESKPSRTTATTTTTTTITTITPEELEQQEEGTAAQPKKKERKKMRKKFLPVPTYADLYKIVKEESEKLVAEGCEQNKLRGRLLALLMPSTGPLKDLLKDWFIPRSFLVGVIKDVVRHRRLAMTTPSNGASAVVSTSDSTTQS
ncbi:carbon-nitrogen ligase-like protein [Thermochaetoides thermophila DSM 1495]|uniref:Altered inheritance of mitochondria protein 41 n=1 Tax=Chaetomium thermophilum (strain DSM 1495 / CBS 144.50 / IMI 039719) TaxID=759272 RepID=G0S860_CHATD|nr:carbon-nitrogen ligase-like protein [Thermochaetoides thermophila DSM 1495]EGS21107.1 carbon-nitrogen ligase-like protein [Thermochaetoides thermophila DSM 1495]